MGSRAEGDAANGKKNKQEQTRRKADIIIVYVEDAGRIGPRGANIDVLQSWKETAGSSIRMSDVSAVPWRGISENQSTGHAVQTISSIRRGPVFLIGDWRYEERAPSGGISSEPCMNDPKR